MTSSASAIGVDILRRMKLIACNRNGNILARQRLTEIRFHP
jgi:hypothetical protein